MLSKNYRNKKVLITGGSGFIGANLASRLVELGSHITLLVHSDASLSNIQDIIERAKSKAVTLEIIVGDIRDGALMEKIVKDKDILFNLVAKISQTDKGVVSYEDLDINIRGQLVLLEMCRLHNPKIKIVFSSTRMVYGDDVKNPIKETSATNPTTLYGIHKLTVEKYLLSYFKRHNIRTTALRIGSPYGDRQHFSKGLYSLPGWFMNRTMNGETVEILSDGKQGRDFIYIGDLVEIMLRTAVSSKTDGKVYNAGSGIKSTFGDMVDAIAKTVPTGGFVYAKNPIKTSVTKDTYSFNISKLTKDIGWKPKTKLREGVRKMYDFAKTHPNKAQ